MSFCQHGMPARRHTGTLPCRIELSSPALISRGPLTLNPRQPGLHWRTGPGLERRTIGTTMDKLFKYILLRHLPGRIGRHYDRQILRVHARRREFPEAVRRSGGMTCIDLGANVGTYTRKMASVAKQVISFEPDPWAHAMLEVNVADLDNVRIENVAAGTREGRGSSLPPCPVCGRSRRLLHLGFHRYRARRMSPAKEAVEVRQVDFIRYLENLNEEIGVLKIDIEGAEVDRLEALLDRPDIMERINWIFAETHESRIPAHGSRVELLRERVQGMQRPEINLYWC